MREKKAGGQWEKKKGERGKDENRHCKIKREERDTEGKWGDKEEEAGVKE